MQAALRDKRPEMGCPEKEIYRKCRANAESRKTRLTTSLIFVRCRRNEWDASRHGPVFRRSKLARCLSRPAHCCAALTLALPTARHHIAPTTTTNTAENTPTTPP